MANGSAALLSQIAQGPNTKFDPMGAINQGIQMGTNLQKLNAFKEARARDKADRETLGQLSTSRNPMAVLRELGASNPDLARKATVAFQELGQVGLSQMSQGIAAANAILANDLEGSKKVLQRTADELPEGNVFKKSINETIGKSEEEYRGSMLRLMDMMIRMGQIEGKTIEEMDLDKIKTSIEERKVDIAEKGLEIDEKQIALKLKSIENSLKKANLKDEEKKFDESVKIRSEIDKASDSFYKISDSFGRISASIKNPSAAGDLALIFDFMKMLDPGSVVREGEFANAQNAAGIPERIRNLFNRVKSGKRLSPKQRNDFVNRAKKIYDEANKRNEVTVDSFVKLGEKFGLDRDLLVVPRGRPNTINDEPTVDSSVNPDNIPPLPKGFILNAKL